MRILFLSFTLFLMACGGSSQPAPFKDYGLRGGADSAGVHTVASGDTVWNISNRYEVSMQDIVTVNRLKSPYVLALGQRITMPPPRVYKVRKGDSLYTISRTFDVSQTNLARINKLKSPFTIHEGQKLNLPVAGNKKTVHRVANTNKLATDKITKKPARKKTIAIKKGKTNFIWPVNGPIISSYGTKENGLHNDGVNIKAQRGDKVISSEKGTVVYAGNGIEGFGNLVLVRHANRWMTAYAHLEKIGVKKGQEIKQGNLIGLVGSSGSVSSPQLHFEMRKGTKALNPIKYLSRQEI
jgi:murein DD-endopeptidase MepM/ murein hydrolase activator NlpD